jgi:hypothetical protein
MILINGDHRDVLAERVANMTDSECLKLQKDKVINTADKLAQAEDRLAQSQSR